MVNAITVDWRAVRHWHCVPNKFTGSSVKPADGLYRLCGPHRPDLFLKVAPLARDTPALPATLTARIERWPIAGAFTISRGAKTEAVVVVAEISRGGFTGRGECTPYARYGETPEATQAAILAMQAHFAAGIDEHALQAQMPAGAARNAVDCALLDLEAKTAGLRVWDLLKRPAPRACTTAYTISLGTPDAMAAATAKAAYRPLLKIKLGSDDDVARIKAVRKAAPESELIVDANEAWTPESLQRNLAACEEAGVTLVEQPLPAGHDEALAHLRRPMAVCADESVHDLASIPGLRGRYDAVNIKLDKAGGLTEALAMADAAQALGLEIMVGCMVATSLAMAPALLLAQQARFVDLDGPLLLAGDRDGGLRYDESTVYPPDAALWG
jgi:L-alanine-DL-glutamate epimerase-like enolase superfamily enzyme